MRFLGVAGHRALRQARMRERACFRGGILAAAALIAAASSQAKTPEPPLAREPFIEGLRLQERERALRDRNEGPVDDFLPRETPRKAERLPSGEAPCFRIDTLRLEGERAEDFQWLLSSAAGPDDDDSPLGHCLGTEGLDILLSRLQQALIARGWATTRVLAGPQDLSGGVLSLTLVPGRIAAIRLADGSSAHATLRNAIPARPGDLLNLRDIEQGLENLKRVPTAEADIKIEPSRAANAAPADSDLVVTYTQARRLRASLSADDGGTQATGRHQGGITLSGDNLLGLNDLFYVSANHSIDGQRFISAPTQGTEGQVMHYSVPHGYWLLSATASSSRYHQTVAGFSQDYVYAGETHNAEVKLSRLVYRDQRRKTTLSVRGFRSESRNFIDDTEIDVQHRIVGGWELGLTYREFFGEATLDANLAYRRGTGAFGAIRAPEEEFGEGTSRLRLLTADLALNLPFKLGEEKLRYSGHWRAQWNRTALTPQDRFGIGGRYTVRGFDGESSLLDDRGWLVRNDIGWTLGESGAELYAGVDYGEVGGPSTQDLLGRHLAGGVIGLRGAIRGLNYDVFIGAPISRPEGFRTAGVSAGFTLNYSF